MFVFVFPDRRFEHSDIGLPEHLNTAPLPLFLIAGNACAIAVDAELPASITSPFTSFMSAIGLTPMLLNAYQREHPRNVAQQTEIAALKTAIQTQRAELAALNQAQQEQRRTLAKLAAFVQLSQSKADQTKIAMAQR